MTLKLASSSLGAQSHTRGPVLGRGTFWQHPVHGPAAASQMVTDDRKEGGTHEGDLDNFLFSRAGSSPGAAWWGPRPSLPRPQPSALPQTLRCVSLSFHGPKWTLLLVGPLKAQVPCHMGTSPFSSHQLCGAAVCALGPPLQPQPRLQTRHPPGPLATEWPTGRAGRRCF